jgi:hypothetical protein
MRLRSTTDSDAPDPTDSTEARTPWPRRLLDGAEGGAVATLALTAYRLPVSRSPPPTARFWAQFVAGGDPEDHVLPGLVLHLLYGTVGGALFGAIAPARGPEREADREKSGRQEAEHEALDLLLGVAYAVALSVFGERVLLNGLLDVDLDPDEALVFHVGHVVYGLSLGTWVGSRTGGDE